MGEVTFYPIMGLVLGANYYSSETDDIDLGVFKKHTIEIFILLFGININWFTDV
jgi:hypothetical protein